MLLYPAIDIINGQAVRLTKGDYSTAKTYATDPVEVAKDFEQRGSKYLHVIDLDGAKQGQPVNAETIQKIKAETDLILQVGGGLRTIAAAQPLIQAGVDRVIIGSIAVKDPATAQNFFKEFGPDRITLALDCQKCDTDTPMMAIHGWQEESTLSLWDLIDQYLELGVSRVLCTDIARDGMNQGCNVALYERMLKRYPGLQVQASGGIASLDELAVLREKRLESCVTGKALYEKRFTLEHALAVAGGNPC